MKKFSLIALLLVLSMVFFGCPNGGGNDDPPVPDPIVRVESFDFEGWMADAGDFIAGVDADLQPYFVGAGSYNEQVTIESVGGEFKITTGATWGAGIDLQPGADAFAFQIDDIITVTGRVETASNLHIDFTPGTETDRITAVMDGDNFTLTIPALTQGNISAMLGSTPPAVRVGSMGNGDVFYITDISVMRRDEPLPPVDVTADDFIITGATQGVGGTGVTITPKPGMSQGEIIIYYDGETEVPTAVGEYEVTFDVAAAPGFNAATGLAGGTYTITDNPPTDFTVDLTGVTVKNAAAITAQYGGFVVTLPAYPEGFDIGNYAQYALTVKTYKADGTTENAAGYNTSGKFLVDAAGDWSGGNVIGADMYNLMADTINGVPQAKPAAMTVAPGGLVLQASEGPHAATFAAYIELVELKFLVAE